MWNGHKMCVTFEILLLVSYLLIPLFDIPTLSRQQCLIFRPATDPAFHSGFVIFLHHPSI